MKAVVVGGGFAGSAAAVLLAPHARVTQVVSGFGASAVSSGAVDFVRATDPATRQRAHALLKFLGMPFRAPRTERAAVPTEAGTVRAAGLLPERVAALDEQEAWAVLVAPGLFDEPRLAVLRQSAVQAGLGADLAPLRCPVPLPAQPLQAASRLDAHAADVLEALARAADGRPVLAPPVFGVRRRHDVLRDAERAGLDLHEMLSHYPSTWGLRHQHALEEAVRGAGVAVVRGTAAAVREDGRVRGVEAAGQRLDADLLVLATGKFLGGGLRRTPSLVGRRSFRDSVLGFDVAAGELRADPFEPDGHGFFRVGLRVDDEGRVLGPDGPVEGVRALGTAVDGNGPPTYGAGDALADALRIVDAVVEGVSARP